MKRKQNVMLVLPKPWIPTLLGYRSQCRFTILSQSETSSLAAEQKVFKVLPIPGVTDTEKVAPALVNAHLASISEHEYSLLGLTKQSSTLLEVGEGTFVDLGNKLVHGFDMNKIAAAVWKADKAFQAYENELSRLFTFLDPESRTVEEVVKPTSS